MPLALRALRGLPPAAPERLPLGCPPLDALLGGGLEAGAVTEVHGEAGTGKTNLCLQAAREAALRGGKVLYLDSEGFSPERLAQICGAALPEVLPRLLVERVVTPADQARGAARALRVAKAVRDVRLVVLDSATLLYRVQLAEGDGLLHRRVLVRQLHGLHALARERGLAVLWTNQVFGLPGEEDVHALGGHALRHLAACVLRLDRVPGQPGGRLATLRKHRARPEGVQARFALAERGLVAAPGWTPDAASAANGQPAKTIM